jgi:hypothetical protein
MFNEFDTTLPKFNYTLSIADLEDIGRGVGCLEGLLIPYQHLVRVGLAISGPVRKWLEGG